MMLVCVVSILLALPVCFSFRTVTPSRTLIVINSQDNVFHRQLSLKLQHSIKIQCEEAGLEKIDVRTIPDDYNAPGSWTLVPVFFSLRSEFRESKDWIIFIEDTSGINVTQLLNTLGSLDEDVEWAGFVLRDVEPTIIHHYRPAGFQDYPLLAAGFAISSSLLDISFNLDPLSEFVIDPAFELSSFLGRPLTNISEAFCSSHNPSCAIFPLPASTCNPELSIGDVFFAVKTCSLYHDDRVPVVLETWARSAARLEFFSDVSNSTIPTVSVGVSNTPRGHCAKTLRILSMALARAPSASWIVLADDDTMLSVPRLVNLLSCYSKDDVVGQRYGFGIRSETGYDYPTGGAGIAFGRTVLTKLLAQCRCSSPDAPDDMTIGACLSTMGVSLVHSSSFHQARPNDYPSPLLKTHPPVSFHKHWLIDPVAVYNEWFGHLDPRFEHPVIPSPHDEL